MKGSGKSGIEGCPVGGDATGLSHREAEPCSGRAVPSPCLREASDRRQSHTLFGKPGTGCAWPHNPTPNPHLGPPPPSRQRAEELRREREARAANFARGKLAYERGQYPASARLLELALNEEGPFTQASALEPWRTLLEALPCAHVGARMPAGRSALRHAGVGVPAERAAPTSLVPLSRRRAP